MYTQWQKALVNISKLAPGLLKVNVYNEYIRWSYAFYTVIFYKQLR
jgi:hypothetical protein